MKKIFSSFSSKTLIYFILFSVIAVFLYWFFQIIYFKFAYELYQIRNLNMLVMRIENTPLTSISSTLEEIAYQNEVCIEYYTNSGRTLEYNTLMNGCALGKNNKEIIEIERDFMSSQNLTQKIRLKNKEYGSKAFLYGVSLDSGTVFLYNNLEDISSPNALFRTQLIFVIFLAILVACVLAYFLSKKLTEPILDITKKAKKLGSGEQVLFPKYDILEVDELSRVLKEAQEEMQKTEELRRDLMANVSHDLKTPLTMIKAYAEMVRDISYKDKKKREENCNIIMQEVDRLNHLVNDILILSKIQANADELNIEEFDLVKEVKEIIKRYEIIKETEDYHFKLDMPRKAIIKADKAKISQVIYNLLNNAINYTGEDKTVTFRLKNLTESYYIEIMDSGKGIDEKEIPHIWDKYYKNEKNHTRNVVGTGLGLSIVKTILEKHHFEYGVKSVKNKGTTFYFYVKK